MDSALSMLTGGRSSVRGLGSSKEPIDAAATKGGKARSFSTQSAPTIDALSASPGSSSSFLVGKRRGAKASASQLKTPSPVCTRSSSVSYGLL